MEGCTGLLEVKDRVLLHEGDILELDPMENTIIHKTHAYLFSDALMLTSWITNRFSTHLFSFMNLKAIITFD